MDKFLQEIQETYDSFELKHKIGYNDLDELFNFDKFDYLLSINKNIRGNYDVTITHKVSAKQQYAINESEEFIINTLRNLYYLGF